SMRNAAVLFAVFLLGCMLAAALENQSFTLEQVMSSPFPSELTFAKHNGRVAWVFNQRGERNVWVADAPGLEPRLVTHYQGDDGEEISSLRLTPDGHAVVYARGTEIGRA